MKKNTVRRIIFGLVGVVGLYAAYYLVTHFAQLGVMGFIGGASYIIATIGSLNWLPVAFTGDGNKDLLSMIGLKKG